MNKTICMRIRVSEEEDKFKRAPRIEAYASYCEFVRRTGFKEVHRIFRESKKEEEDKQ